VGVAAADLNLFDAGVDASWEVDIFGARRASIAGARADFARERSLRRLTLVTVAAEVVLAYTDVRGTQRVWRSHATMLQTRRARLSSRNSY
jgi:outer membrane protein, multidrug efflux system